MAEQKKYRQMFVDEAHEHIQTLNECLLKFEKEPQTQEHLNMIFRSAHTLKGMASMMGYDQITQLSHAIEEFLDKILKEKTSLTIQLTNSLFRCFDTLQQLVDDDNKKVNIEQYLSELQGVTTLEASDDSELSLDIQLPTIRVKMDNLDALVNLVGELLIVKMRLGQAIRMKNDSDTAHSIMALGGLLSELQDHAMSLRLVPIDQIFNRFHRMLRDLSVRQGKDIRFEMDGFDIELDRTILDAITYPLLHILRNAVDHGIEPSDERIKSGKSRTGKIRLVASRLADKVIIQVEDDGRGVDVEAIRSVAIKNNMIDEKQARLLTVEELLTLLGTPGLSSKSTITDLSGRGVGMNVVRKQIDAIGGQTKIQTKKGHGTQITLILPLSLAIIEGLLVSAGREEFVLPLSNVKKTLQLGSSEIRSVRGKEVITYMDSVIPLTRLATAVGLDRSKTNERTDEITVVIVEKDNKLHGLVVDSYEHRPEIVIKRLASSKIFSSQFSNATILPDGNVALIVDPALFV